MDRRFASVPILRALTATALALLLAPAAAAQKAYFPAAGDWERRAPAEVGMDAARLEAAVDFAIESETDAPRDLELNHYMSFGREPFGDAIGPFKERGDPAGVIIRNGYIVAEWGDPERVDVTFSVTKSFITAVVGLAYDRGLIRDVHDPVHPYTAPVTPVQMPFGEVRGGAERLGESAPLEPFESEHARGITWDHLLRQTSDWSGTLWGKPDWADRPARDLRAEMARERHEPGTVYEYNDVRVNLLALAALNVWRQPLPRVLREHLMGPIGASPTWRWHGYDNSWVVLDGEVMQSPAGGAHWGGGMWISALDQARFGLLTARDGRWGEERILSEEWLRMARTPGEVNPAYGFMNWFLGQDFLPSATPGSFAHMGAGTNMVYVDPAHDLVVVARWIERGAIDELVRRVLDAVVE